MSAVDSVLLRQAIADFELFLNGQRAPALIGQSLGVVIRLDVRQIAQIVINWSLQQRQWPLLDVIMAARSKVFDVFFYRVVRFEYIYSFFPTFEQALVTYCPQLEQANLIALLRQSPWQEIRPLGSFRQSTDFVMENRTETKVQADKFNEDIYRNATFTVLSADKRYEFNDEKTSNQIAAYQAKVRSVFEDFVERLEDNNQKKEILLANEADKYNNYQKKEAFKAETYITQLLDLAIALFNDDFFYHSIQVFAIIQEIQVEAGLKLEDLKKFQEKGELFATQKLEDYTNTRTNCFLIKQALSIFTYWQPRRLFAQLQTDENRRTRRLILKILECYGKDIYGLLLAELQGKGRSLPWWYARNLIYLLGRIPCEDEPKKKQAIDLIYEFWQPKTQRQLLYQLISTLGFIGTEQACNYLIERLKTLEPEVDNNRQVEELYQKIVAALISIEADRALEKVIESAVKFEQLGQHVEKFSRIYLSESLIEQIVARIRKEVSRLKYTFSFLGDKKTALDLLRIIGHMGTESVQEICKDIVKALPRKHELVAEAERILAGVMPLPRYARDNWLQRLAVAKNHPEIVCHIYEMGLSGRLSIRTLDGVECQMDFERGTALRAAVSAYYLERDDAFYWSFLLDAADIESIYFNAGKSHSPAQLRRATDLLIRDSLIQRNQVLQIATAYIAPNSRLRQKPVNTFYTNFSKKADPEKYTVVWNALAEETDLQRLQQVTKLTKHDVYKIVFDFLRQNMITVDDDGHRTTGLNFEDAFRMLNINLKRIEQRPVMFNYYRISSEICADVMRTIPDEVIRFAFGVLRTYFLDHYQRRKVFALMNVDICRQLLERAAVYLQTEAIEARQGLLDYVSFTFEVTDEALQKASAMLPEPVVTSFLERLENIESTNDPLDGIDDGLDELLMDEMLGSLDSVLGSGLGMVNTNLNYQNGLTASEEAMIRELFDNIALAYVKPLKDFVRELQRNQQSNRPTFVDWWEIVEPVLTLLSGSSGKMGYQQVADAVTQLHQALANAKQNAEAGGQDYFPETAVPQVLALYEQLVQLQPRTFALIASEEDIAERKEILIVKFILKQVPEVTDKLLNKIIFAGLNTFDKFLQSKPDEIAALTGMAKSLAEEIYFKFYQYRNVYYPDTPDYEQKFIAMYELNLRLLKQAHTDLETLNLNEQLSQELATHREELTAERQRLLWSLFILLCIKQEYDVVETIQQSVFEVRIQLLDEYFLRFAAVA